MVTPLPTVSCLCTLCLALSHTTANAAAFDNTLEPLPSVQHPALLAELINSEPAIYDLGYLRIEAAPCLPLAPSSASTNQLPAPTRPVTNSDATLQQHHWRQLQHRQPEPAQGPHVLCHYPVP